MTRPLSTLVLGLALTLLPNAPLLAQAGIEPPLLNTPVDVSTDFQDFTRTYFVADRLSEFDPSTAEGASPGSATGSPRGTRSTTPWPA